MSSELIQNLESYYGEHYKEDELKWIQADIAYVPVTQHKFLFNKLKEKHATLPKPSKIGKMLYDLGLKKREGKTIKEIHNCHKCDFGNIYVFDIKKYKYYLTGFGRDLRDLCELDLCRYSVNCMDVDSKYSINIHEYLRKIQNFGEREFQYAYITLFQFYRSFSTTGLDFDKFSPYSFWGINEILKPLFIKDILNENIKNELLKQENSEDVKFDKIEEETFVNKSEW